MERGVPIRSISRCIAVLQAISRHGSLSLMDTARMSRLPYPTTCRIIQTLIHEGLVECEPTRKWYRATGLVHTLSHGFSNRDDLVVRARPSIVALTRKVGWPVSITTRVGHSMMIRDTTNDLSALTARVYPPGLTRPLLECAAGLVYFAHLDEGGRRDLLASIEPRERPSSPPSDAEIARIREDGYAVGNAPDTADIESTSWVSVPLHDDTRLVGALTLVFFTSSMSISEALARYLPDLTATSLRITAAIRSGPPAAAAASRSPRAARSVSRARTASA